MKNLRTCPKCLSLGFTPPTFISKILSEIILFSLSPFLVPACPGWVYIKNARPALFAGYRFLETFAQPKFVILSLPRLYRPLYVGGEGGNRPIYL